MCQVTQITGLAPQAGLCMVGRHLSRLGCSGNLPTTGSGWYFATFFGHYSDRKLLLSSQCSKLMVEKC